jgi:hypothetical protein
MDKKTIKLRKLSVDEVEISLIAEPEFLEPDFDEETNKAVLLDLEDNEWAWCSVCVTATWNNFEGFTYLGGCSYKSAEDFKENSMYYEEMVAEVLDDLNNTLQGVANKLAPLFLSVSEGEQNV